MNFNNYLGMTIPPKEMPILEVSTPEYSVIPWLTADTAFKPSEVDYKIRVTLKVWYDSLDVLNDLRYRITQQPNYKASILEMNSVTNIPTHLLVHFSTTNKYDITAFLQYVNQHVLYLNEEINDFNTKILPTYIEKYETVLNMMKD